MGFLDKKHWMAQNLYNEYLELKREITEKAHQRDCYQHVSHLTNATKRLEQELQKDVERMKNLLGQMEVMHGINAKDLLLLSMGVDIA